MRRYEIFERDFNKDEFMEYINGTHIVVHLSIAQKQKFLME